MNGDWTHVGNAFVLARRPLQSIDVGGRTLALSFKDGVFGAIDGFCPHRWVLLGHGQLDGDEVVCPSHDWRFHRCTGEGTISGTTAYAVKVEDGEVWVRKFPGV